MALSYDFDIHWLVPPQAVATRSGPAAMAGSGFDAGARDTYVALFRDPRTVELVKRAGAALGDWLQASGFGLDVYDSGAGPGRYPAHDEAARNDVISRLSETMRGTELKRANLNGFDLGEFLKAVVEARPLDAAPRRSAPQAAERAPKPRPQPIAAPAGTVSNIDAAFANPKAGAPLPESEGRTPTLDDLLGAPAHPGSPDGPGGAPVDDLKFHSTVAHRPKASSGVPMMPMIMVAAVMFFFILFMAVGGPAETGLVAR